MKYIVNNSNDFGTGSLREALELANANCGEDKIVIKVGNINLSSGLSVTDSTIIQGNGVVITQTGCDRLFTVDDNNDQNQINLTLRNLSLTGGNPHNTGGAIYSTENLKLNKVSIYDNATTLRGGAIYVEGANVLINNSHIFDNTIDTAFVTSAGGGIYVKEGTLKIANSTVTDNVAGVAGGVAVNGSQAVIKQSEVSNNFGNGIAVLEGNVKIINTEINSNVGNFSGGGLALELNSSATITNSVIRNNEAVYGGGVSVVENSSLELVNSLITGNVAGDGGAIDTYLNSDVKIVNSTISDNSAFYIDGIANYDGTGNIEIIDSIITDTVEGQPDLPIAETDKNPIRIEAEDADRFYDTTFQNLGGEYRQDGLDIEASGDSDGGYNVGWIEAGESLEYDVNIAESGSYDVLLRVATDIWETKEIEVSIDDISVGTVSFGHTGGWQSYTDVIIEDVAIEAGMKEIQLDALTSQFNINYIELI